MLLTEVLYKKSNKNNPILLECSEYLEESKGYPLFKNLPVEYDDIHKVKVRQRKRNDNFTKTFNEAFTEVPNLRQRSIFTNGEMTFIKEDGKREPFFIFPINGYKYKYSPEVTNSKEDYQQAFDVILEQIDEPNVLKDILKYTYISENLSQGISQGSEIIFYGIPYYYAVRVSSIDTYEQFVEKIKWNI